jgi:hypothetical protein
MLAVPESSNLQMGRCPESDISPKSLGMGIMSNVPKTRGLAGGWLQAAARPQTCLEYGASETNFMNEFSLKRI